MRIAAVLLLIAVLLTAAIDTRAGTVDRLGGEYPEERLSIIKKGLSGRLRNPEERAQFHLLLCRPDQAWKEAERIMDPDLKRRFEGVILALVATPRSAELQGRVSPATAKVEARFALDQDEIWSDELDGLEISSDCDFPFQRDERARGELMRTARERLEPFADSPRFGLSFLALVTDVGLVPVLAPLELSALAGSNGDSAKTPYLSRLKFFADAEKNKGVQGRIEISGLKARSPELRMYDVELVAHRLELPWLLRE